MSNWFDRFMLNNPALADLFEAVVRPRAARPRGPWGFAPLLFEARANPVCASLAKWEADEMSRVFGHFAREHASRIAVTKPGGHALRRVIVSDDGSDRARVTATIPDVPGRVGPFFAVREGGKLHLIAYAVVLRHADVYGENMTVDLGHDRIWEALRTRGSQDLAAAGLPLAPLTEEYDLHPRGRVVYSPAMEEFTILADRKLHRSSIIDAVKALFEIGSGTCRLLDDDHYRTQGQLGGFDVIQKHNLAA